MGLSLHVGAYTSRNTIIKRTHIEDGKFAECIRSCSMQELVGICGLQAYSASDFLN
jgi:hypothetical protein